MNKVIRHTNLLTGEEICTVCKVRKKKPHRKPKQYGCVQKCVPLFSFEDNTQSNKVSRNKPIPEIAGANTLPTKSIEYTQVVTTQVPRRGQTDEQIINDCVLTPNILGVYANSSTEVILVYCLPRPIHIIDYVKVQKDIIKYLIGPKVNTYGRQSIVPISSCFLRGVKVSDSITITEADIDAAINSHY